MSTRVYFDRAMQEIVEKVQIADMFVEFLLKRILWVFCLFQAKDVKNG